MGIEELILEQERKAAENKGEKRGEKRRNAEIVLSSFENGLSTPLISNITGLSEKEVLKILKDHKKV